MALIICPYCKKTISNTAEFCIHCGKPITPPTAGQPVRQVQSEKAVQVENGVAAESGETKTKNFEELPFEEKNRLRRQFNAKYPQYARYNERDLFAKKSNVFEWISGIAVVLLLVLMLRMAIKSSGEDGWKAEAWLIAAVILVVLDCVAEMAINIHKIRSRKKRLRVLKLYVKWLYDEKGIVYRVKFDRQYAKFKTYYDRINVDYEKI